MKNKVHRKNHYKINNTLVKSIFTLAAFIIFSNMAVAMLDFCEEKEESELKYRTKYEKVLKASEDLDKYSYLAFPSVLQIDSSMILISYKRGEAHGGDPGAKLEIMKYDVINEMEIESQIIGDIDDLIFQMGEWVKFPNGDIINYVDVQKIVHTPNYKKNHRTGIYYSQSQDGGNNFSPMQKMRPVNGLEYGYVFEDIIVGSYVYMLVMTFPELVEKIGENGWKYGKVHVIRSNDNGKSWEFVRDLSKEFGDIDINESSFVKYGNGFIVTTRGYDNLQRLHVTNSKFEVIKQINLTEEYDCIQGLIGRPRLFHKDGAIYLLGRDYTDPFSLKLYKFDPNTLRIDTYVTLDQRPGDAYYAEHFFIQKKGKTFFNVITYVKSVSNLPDIVRLEFLWEEISGITK